MNRARVLIVDDEPINLVLLESLLEDDHEVKTMDSGDEALAFCLSQPEWAEVILSDVMMPGLSGYDLCRKLAEHDSTRAIPVLLVSSLDTEEDEMRGLEAGAADLIRKPFSPTLLMKRVDTQVRLRKLGALCSQHGLSLP